MSTRDLHILNRQKLTLKKSTNYSGNESIDTDKGSTSFFSHFMPILHICRDQDKNIVSILMLINKNN